MQSLEEHLSDFDTLNTVAVDYGEVGRSKQKW